MCIRDRIYCTRVTAQLMGIMLRDSAHIQESDARWKNQKGRRAGAPAVEPLYSLADAEAALELVVPCEYGREVRIDDHITASSTLADPRRCPASVKRAVMWSSIRTSRPSSQGTTSSCLLSPSRCV